MPSTVQPYEIVFVLAALPGLLIWISNRLIAGKNYRAAKSLIGGENGINVAAKFIILDTYTHIAVEVTIIFVGILLMFYPPNPAGTLVSRWAIGGSLIFLSILITFLGYRWRKLNTDLLRWAALDRMAAKG